MVSLRRKKQEQSEGEAEQSASTQPRASRLPKLRVKPMPSRMGKKGRFVLILGDDGAILVFLQGGKVQRRLFAPSSQPEHVKTLRELMETHPHAPLYVLLDVIDQQYVKQTFPPVSSLSVNKLVQRRLDRDFPPEDIKGYMRLGREKTGRKEWQFLLVSIAKTPLLQSWLDVLMELPNAFKGTFLTPIEAQHILPSIANTLSARGADAASPWKLIISHHKVGGYRQIVLRDGKLAFTRLTQAPDDTNPAISAGSIEQEIQNTIDYLRRLDFIDNQQMSIYAIVSQEIKALLDLRRFGTASSNVLTPFELSNEMALEQAALSADRYGDVVMATLFGQTAKPVQAFMPVYAAELAKWTKLRQAAVTAAGVIGVGCLLMATSALVGYFSASSEANAMKEELRTEESRLAQVQGTIKALDDDANLAASVAALYKIYTPDDFSLTEFLTQLAGKLPEEARLTSLEWKRTNLPLMSPQGMPQPASPTALPFEATLNFEFIGNYKDQEELQRAMEAFDASLKLALTDYDITSDLKTGGTSGDSKVEIDLDQAQQSAPIEQGKNTVKYTLKGPKAAPASAVAAPAGLGMPAALPGGAP
jgi:hypothetical protein